MNRTSERNRNSYGALKASGQRHRHDDHAQNRRWEREPPGEVDQLAAAKQEASSGHAVRLDGRGAAGSRSAQNADNGQDTYSPSGASCPLAAFHRPQAQTEITSGNSWRVGYENGEAKRTTATSAATETAAGQPDGRGGTTARPHAEISSWQTWRAERDDLPAHD
jgi:hypothetical protein